MDLRNRCCKNKYKEGFCNQKCFDDWIKKELHTSNSTKEQDHK